MPKLDDYFGIRVYFYAGDHQPIHVHGLFQGRESNAEILVENGEIQRIRFVRVKDAIPLPPQKQRDFEALVAHEAENIVRSWKEFEEHGTHPKVKKITRKIK
ncbi:MAG TPA: DUF4160 domain-containing protein [Candidatus Kapabacteria bacterium]|nr:DUF4160 domain-containing protein [Candidatus Kapabacteria bacterium]